MAKQKKCSTCKCNCRLSFKDGKSKRLKEYNFGD